MFTITLRALAFCLVALMLSALDANAQAQVLSEFDASRISKPGRLTLPVLRPLENPVVLNAVRVNDTTVRNRGQQTAPSKCRRGRRALIGALIGIGGSVPLAVLAHTRWENEAANGAAAAATTLALSAAGGAFIGLATCGN